MTQDSEKTTKETLIAIEQQVKALQAQIDALQAQQRISYANFVILAAVIVEQLVGIV